jgi:hypothetical protein
MKKAREGCMGNGDSNARVAVNEEGEGSKAIAMVMATGIVEEWNATATMRLIAMARRVAGKQW